MLQAAEQEFSQAQVRELAIMRYCDIKTNSDVCPFPLLASESPRVHQPYFWTIYWKSNVNFCNCSQDTFKPVQKPLHKKCKWEEILNRKLHFLCSEFYPQCLYSSRSSHQRCSTKKGVLKNLTKFTGKYLRQSCFFNEVFGLWSVTLLKKKLRHKFFPVSFTDFLGTTFYWAPPSDCFCSRFSVELALISSSFSNFHWFHSEQFCWAW